MRNKSLELLYSKMKKLGMDESIGKLDDLQKSCKKEGIKGDNRTSREMEE